MALVFLIGWLASNLSQSTKSPAPEADSTSLPDRLSLEAPPTVAAEDREHSATDLSTLAGKSTDPADRKALTERLQEWAGLDGAAAAAWVEEHLQGTLRRDTLFNVLAAWGESDPEGGAADFVLTLRHDPIFDAAVQGLVHGWAKSNPAAAGEWLTQKAPRGEEADNAAGQLAKAWAGTDPVAAAAWAVEYFRSSDNGLAFQRAIAAWAVYDLHGASAFVNTAPPDLQFQGYMQISMAWAKADAPAAAEWADGLESSRIRHGAIATIVETWSRQAPAEAAAFVSGIESEEAKATAARFLIGNWVETDMVAASSWLGSLPEGNVRDEAVAELGNRLLDSDPESALTWSLSIRDNTLRDAQIEDLLHSWLLRDESTAREWMGSHAIPIDLLATLEDKL